MFIVLTGNPNSCKTQFINRLKLDGYEVFNVDEFVRNIYQVNEIGYILIRTHFGVEYTNANEVDRKKLGDLIVNDEFSKAKIKSLIWPLIKSKLAYLKKRNEFMIVEMAIYKTDPLYFYGIFDKVIELKNNNEIKNDKSKFQKFYEHDHAVYQYDYLIQYKDSFQKTYLELEEILKELNPNKPTPLSN